VQGAASLGVCCACACCGWRHCSHRWRLLHAQAQHPEGAAAAAAAAGLRRASVHSMVSSG
jgi:hypothetical protein